MEGTRMKTIAIALGLACAGLGAHQEGSMKHELIEYKHGDVVLQGYLAWNGAVAGKRPGVIIFHEWKGHGDYVRRRADQLASLGYAAFAADMYGKGVYAKDHEEAGKLAGVFFGDRKKMRERAAAGLEAMKKHASVDPARIAAMGYCFGGTTALEMARGGQELLGAASFHGNLAVPPNSESVKPIRAKIIAFHGADDSFVPAEVVKAFHQEMKAASADYQFVAFGGAVHSFTVKEAGSDPSTGMAYNEKAD